MTQADERESARKKKLEEIREAEEEDFVQRKAAKLGLPSINLTLRLIPQEALKVVPEEKARTARALAFQKNGDVFSLAAENPNDEKTQAIIRELSAFGRVDVYVASPRSIETALKGYAAIPKEAEKLTGEITVSPATEEKYGKRPTLEDVTRLLGELAEEDASVIAEQLLAAAAFVKSSDIHLEPEEKETLVRFRIDGILHPVTVFPPLSGGRLVDRVKLRAGMKLNIRDRAQDGRFTIKLPKKNIDIRASATPGAYGENIVLRLLYPDTIALNLEDLGMRAEDLAVFHEQLAKPNGMILNTGPTGSGKTTTLYAFLKKKRTPEIKIITIEDPIEYHLEGISQTQVEREKGYDFATGLRAALRQDPDVILVGEIRDAETARTAADAALTGHLVFSTLHTNEAAGTIPRLEELGIPRRTITASCNLVIAQRLVRRLCTICKQPYAPDAKTERRILDALAALSPKAGIKIPAHIKKLWRAKGCPDCWNLGYRGQIGIFEYFVMTPTLANAIVTTATIPEIRAILVTEGMVPLLADGYLKAIEGVTDLEEIARVAGK